MAKLTAGVVAGIAFGVVAVLTMLPLSFPDKRTALVAAFISRFAIGFVVANIQLPWPGWVSGLLLGVLLSLPDALVTRSYAPILVMGGLGGLVIGGLIHGWSARA